MNVFRVCPSLLAAALASGCIIKRVDDHTFDIHGIETWVEIEAAVICPGKTRGASQTIDSEAARTVTGNVESTRTMTGSCDRSGTCLQTSYTSSTPITWTRSPRKHVRVTCPSSTAP